nr:hypothetical protein BaRGS_025195 [Batillaria attramentaria]
MTSYGYDQPADGVTGPKPNANPTNYGYDQPGDREPASHYGFGQQGYGYPPSGPYTSQPAGGGNQTNIVVCGQPGIIAVAPMRENTPPPDTACGLVLSILVLIICAWPCGIGAIVANRRAKSLVDVGQHTQARSALTTMWVWICVSILFGIGAWIYIGFRIKAAMDVEKNFEHSGYDDTYYTAIVTIVINFINSIDSGLDAKPYDDPSDDAAGGTLSIRVSEGEM